jgi:predicted transcriptional regulator
MVQFRISGAVVEGFSEGCADCHERGGRAMDDVKVLHIGVAPVGYIKRRMIEIARGGKPLPGEPKLWVSSLESLAKVLSDKNMLLLTMIRNSHPQSLTELSRISGRAVSNLSRTLHSMERLGLVEFAGKSRGRKAPMAIYTKVKVECTIQLPASEAA